MAGQRRVGWYHGWNVVGACVLVQMCAIGLTVNCFSLFLPSWMHEFNVPASSLALAITLFSIGTIATQYLIGICSTRYPARLVVGTGLAILAGTLILVSQARAGWHITAIYIFVMPFALGLTGAVPLQSLVSRWFLQRSGIAIGLTALGLALGGVVFPPIIVELLPQVGWRWIWAGMGLFVLLVTMPVAMLIMRNRPLPDDPAMYARPAEGQPLLHATVSLREILSRRNFWISIYAFLSMICIAMTVAIDISPILGSYGASTAMIGLFVSVCSMAQLASKLGSGWLADRAGTRLPMIVIATLSGAGALLLSVPQANSASLIGVAIITGAVGGAWTMAAHSQVVEFGPANFGRAFGVVCTISPLTTLAPPIIAKFEETTGSFAPALAFLGVNSLVAAVVVALFYRKPVRLAAPTAEVSPA
jgi:MFS family permease